MFTPMRVPRGSGTKSRLAPIRHTVGVDETGMIFDISDNWTQPEVAHRALPQRWTGVTVFRTSGFDVTGFGGDQRRQSDQAEARCSPTTLRLLLLPERDCLVLVERYYVPPQARG